MLHHAPAVHRHALHALRALAIGLVTATVAASAPAVAAPCRVGTICAPPTDRERTPSTPPTTAQGSIRPAYYVLAVIYAPPGTNGGKTSTQVEYASGSTAGASTAATASFKTGVKVSASAGGGVFGGATVSTDFETTSTTTDGSSLDIKKSTTSTIRVSGGGVDGIDHDKDLIYLWLNPRVDLTRTGDQVTWALRVAGPSMSIQYAYVGWLRRPATMPDGVRAALAGAGVTAADYPTILAADPFATGATTIDPARFVRTPTSIPYIPPYGPTDPVATWSFNQKSETVASTTSKAEHEYSVGIGVGASTDLVGLFKAELKTTTSFKWTSTNTMGRSAGASESANLVVGGPGYGYGGPTEIDVYWDTLYKTFMFAFAPPREATASGTVVSATGAPAAGREVTIAVGGATWRTFTDARGQFRFTGTATGDATIAVAGRTVALLAGAGAQVRIKLPLTVLGPKLPR